MKMVNSVILILTWCCCLLVSLIVVMILNLTLARITTGLAKTEDRELLDNGISIFAYDEPDVGLNGGGSTH